MRIRKSIGSSKSEAGRPVGRLAAWGPSLGRTGVCLASIVVGLVLAELVLRLVYPHAAFGSARELSQFRGSPQTGRLFRIDPQFGFRPVLGTGLYNRYGTLTNDYPVAKSPGVRRILFLGDSVTARGRLVDALRRRYGPADFEYWNAGVESFNTVQEVAYYRRFCAELQPDHVVLTFHLNDFETTPVAFRAADGSIAVYAPNFPVGELNPVLYRHSYLYRLALGVVKRGNRHVDSVIDETEAALIELRDALRASGTRLTVLVFPFLEPWDDWSRGNQHAHQLILNMLERYDIAYVDLLEPVQEAIRAGVCVQEHKGDTWHPSQALATRLAAYLQERDLLAKRRGATCGSAQP